MRGVMDNGSAASVFSGYPIPVGGKTGTAQVSSTKSENGIMTAFAPFDNPEIVISCVIEQGSGGTEVGYSGRDVFDYYFSDRIAAMYSSESEEDEDDEDDSWNDWDDGWDDDSGWDDSDWDSGWDNDWSDDDWSDNNWSDDSWDNDWFDNSGGWGR